MKTRTLWAGAAFFCCPGNQNFWEDKFKMKILVINCGSSSLKFQLIDMEGEQVLCKGLCERIGMDGSCITYQGAAGKAQVETPFPTHTEAFDKVVELMTTGEGKVIDSKADIGAIGHRGVHGGEKIKESCLVTEEVIRTIEELAPLAPLHNPATVLGLRAAQKVFPGTPNVAVFDTAFHSTMPAQAYMYALPYEYYEKYGVRRYGFHGTSHKYVSLRAADFLGRKPQELKMVTCHLGNGSSVAAVDGGRVVDTSMGLTPLAGLIMGTRCGDVDPSAVTYLQKCLNVSADEMDSIMNKQSGLLGVSGVSSDKRDVEGAAAQGNERAKLASNMLNYQIKKLIGGYAAAMGGLDCVVFTGGIGEHDGAARAAVCDQMAFLGLAIDSEKNKHCGDDVTDITAEGAKVRALVVCTNEELMIARETLEVVGQ